MELTYDNLNQERPLECKFMLPLEKSTLLAKFEAVIDDKSFLTKVMKKEKAEEKYDDAVADGKAAVIAKLEKKEENMTIKLGNLMPG